MPIQKLERLCPECGHWCDFHYVIYGLIDIWKCPVCLLVLLVTRTKVAIDTEGDHADSTT